MNTLQGILLGALQGIAEFLPISSSGHLAVAQNLFGLDDLPLLFDVFLHIATLFAVCLYFRKKIWALLKCLGRWISKRSLPQEQETDDFLCGTDQRGRKTIIAILISTFITGIMGIFSSKLIPSLSIKVTCAGFIITAIFLIISAAISKKNNKNLTEAAEQNQGITVLQALVIGFMQGIGTLPGISRSGSTIAGALFSGLNQKAAGDYSFIISIPAILGAFILELKDLGQVTEAVGIIPLIAGCITAFVVGYLSLAFLMKLIHKGKLHYFAFYLIPVGILGLIFLH